MTNTKHTLLLHAVYQVYDKYSATNDHMTNIPLLMVLSGCCGPEVFISHCIIHTNFKQLWAST